MTPKQDKMNDFFDKKWRSSLGNEFTVRWCNLCDMVTISCERCGGSTCNCCSCSKCEDDFKEFRTYKCCIEDYLTKEEIKIYYKALRIKKHILETIPRGIKRIESF